MQAPGPCNVCPCSLFVVNPWQSGRCRNCHHVHPDQVINSSEIKALYSGSPPDDITPVPPRRKKPPVIPVRRTYRQKEGDSPLITISEENTKILGAPAQETVTTSLSTLKAEIDLTVVDLSSIESKGLSRRDHIATELLTTERTYIENLTKLVKGVIQPLKEMIQSDLQTAGGTGSRIRRGTSRALLTEEQITSIFANLTQLLALNTVLLDDLEKKLQHWNDQTTTIGDVLLELTPYLKEYVVYARMNEKAQDLLGDLEKDIAFQTFVKKWETAEAGGGTLRSYLILPIQRIPRYEDFVKYTYRSHPDFDNLVKAFDEIKKVNQIIDDNIHQSNNRLKIIEISRSFIKPPASWAGVGNVPKLIEAHRVFIKEGPLTKICRNKDEERWFFLFNDILLYASRAPVAQKKFVYHKMFPLESLRIDDLPDRVTSTKEVRHAFKVVNPNKSFIVYGKSHDAKIEWMLELNHAINAWKEKQETLLHERADASSLVEAPVWIPDTEVKSCMLCTTSFSKLRRRHHCRACGKVVCGTCSSRRLILNNLAQKAVRVCDSCFDVLIERGSAVRSK